MEEPKEGNKNSVFFLQAAWVFKSFAKEIMTGATDLSPGLRVAVFCF